MEKSRSDFERACREQNERVAREVAEARKHGLACDVVPMLAFGGIDYCRTHRVMGPCPYFRLFQVVSAPEPEGGAS